MLHIQHIYCVSIFLSVSNRDDSNRDDKKHVNSHLICYLEEKKTLNSLHNSIEAHHTYLVFGFYFFAAYTFYRNIGNRDGRLPV